MPKAKLLRPSLLLALYALLAATIAALIILLLGPDSLLILMMIPVLYAAFHYRRWVWLVMIIMGLPLTFYVIHRVSSNLSASVTTMTVVTVATGAMAEVIKRMVEARDRAYRALGESEARYRAIVEDQSELICRFLPDDTLTFVNEVYCRYFGKRREDLVGHKFTPLIPEEDRDRVTQDIVALSPQHPAATHEHRVVAADGCIHWQQWSNRALFDERGQLIELQGVGRDITERKRAEQIQAATYRISESVSLTKNLRELFRSIHGILGELMPARNFYIALYDPATEMLSFPYFVDEHDETPPPRKLGRGVTEYVLRTGKPFLAAHESFSDRATAGELGPVGAPSICWLGVPLKVEDRLIGVLAVQSYTEGVRYGEEERDILVFVSAQVARAIERKRAEEERQRLQAQVQHVQKLESLGVLAGGIAHDFNNLLGTILGNADLALMDLPADSPARASLEEIGKAVRRASELSNQMLAYSGRGRFIVQPINLSDLVREMGELLKVSISKKAALEYDLMDDLPAIMVDATQVRQVVMNLITNASEALGENDGRITIRTRVVQTERDDLSAGHPGETPHVGQYACLQVADTGCGMDEATKARIFEPFFTTKFTGRGLGLSAVLGIVRSHKGTIQVDTIPGQGTTFTVLFPLTEEPSVAPPQKGAPATSWRASGTILVVDDEEAVRAVAGTMLERSGFTVLTASDGRQAVEVYRAHAGELAAVLLDMNMPEMGGEETFRALQEVHAGIPVIVTSGYGEQDIIDRFAGQGFAGFIQKPFEFEALLRIVHGAVSQRASPHVSTS
jgi:PAS domain S-box-containing protein